MTGATRFRRLLHVVLALVFLQLGIARAHAQSSFSAIVTFGTSLSDPGNAFALIKTNATPPGFGTDLESLLIPSAPYARGGHHLSNGSTWVEQMAQALRLTASANAAFASNDPKALNYAVGGARATEDGLNLNLPTQVGAFLQDVNGAAPSDALYVIEMGSNDVRAALVAAGAGANPDTILTAAVQGIGTAIDALYAAGARHFLVLDVPPIALTPAIAIANAVAPGTAGFVDQLTHLFNAKLALMLSAKAAYPGITIAPFDVYTLIASIVANPQAFGLSNVTDACITPNVAPFTCQNPDAYLFWDGIHPTKVVHGIIADQAELAVIP